MIGMVDEAGVTRQGISAEVWGVAAALAALTFGLFHDRYFFHDDAYISLRYALNLLHHGALDWNPGEAVEGYTNFLHVVIASGLMGLGLGPEIAVRAINLISALALIGLTVPAVRLVAPGPERAAERALAIAAVGATPGIALWVMGGLEPVMLAALLLAGIVGVLVLARDGWRRDALALAIISFALAVLTRMDGAVTIAFAGLALALSGQRRLSMAVLVVALPAAVSLIHMAWRYQIYGELMPLTFAAKAGMPWVERTQSLWQYLREMPGSVPLVYAGMIATLAGIVRMGGDWRFRVPAIILAGQIAYVVWSGGDHMPGGRVLLVALVPAALVLLTVLTPRARQIGQAIMALILVLSIGGTLVLPQLRMDPAAFVGSVVGRYIAQAWPEGSLVALHAAGAAPFYANDRLRFIDMLGLNDAHIAHRQNVPQRARLQVLPGHFKGDGAYVLSRQPDYIIAGTGEGRPVGDRLFLSDVELAEQSEFARCYALHSVTLPVPPDLIAASPFGAPDLVFQYYQRTCP